MDQNNPDFVSPSKSHHRSSENGYVNGFRKPEMPDSLKSNGHYTEFSPARTNSLPPTLPSRNKKAFTMPLGMTMLLCFASVFIFIGTLGRQGPVHTLSLVPTLGRFRSYRRLRTDVVLDPFRGGIFGRGTVRLKELEVCQGFEDLVPCYNTPSSFGALEDGQDRLCQLPDKAKPCLIQPPEDYHIPLRWPESREMVWHANMKFVGWEQLSLAGASSLRLVLEDNGQVLFNPEEEDGMVGLLQKVTELVDSLNHTKINKILDIGCGLSQHASHRFPEDSLILCVAPYEANGSRVQFALERGLPGVIGSITNRQLPFSASSFDMIFCSECGFDWTDRGGVFILELDRLCKPGGYYIEGSPGVMLSSVVLDNQKDVELKEDLASRMCWSVVARLHQAIVWKKTENETCYSSRGKKALPKLCDIRKESNSSSSSTLQSCLMAPPHATEVKRQQHLGNLLHLRNLQGSFPGFSNEELLDGPLIWSTIVKSYWSLLTPLIFSDHPKRPGEEDPLPPSNIVRNVMDMNAVYGSLNTALLAAGKSVWVMNVVPSSGPSTLPILNDKGLIGISHDWCEAFSTYPRTYDLLHAIGLLSQEGSRANGCGLSNLFLEMDRILRPEGWVILRDKAELIEDARIAASQMRWESRVVELEGLHGLQLLVCQKTFWKNQSLKSPVS